MPDETDLHILYEDRDIIAIDKPAKLLSVPGRGPEKQDSVQTRVAFHYPGATAIHRLDMCTSGIMLLAKHKESERYYKKLFEIRQVNKIYYAIVHGIPTSARGSIDFPLCVDWANRPRQQVSYEHGKPALTDYALIAKQENSSRIQLMPQTGRSHQLRVHMCAIGHPIVGDTLYGYPSDLLQPRLLLHAARLRLTMMDGKPLDISSALPF